MAKECWFPVAIIYIIAVEFCERLCYYTFLGTQKTFLQKVGDYGAEANAKSSSINLFWSEMSYVACFFGGWLASTRLGIFKTIAILAFTYAIGTFLGAFAALPVIQESGYSLNIYFFAVFGLVAVGCGGIKPNVPVMGANQIDPNSPNAEEARASFFMYFYLAINAGSLISHAFLTSWATSGVPELGVTDEYGYFFAWSIAGGFMLLACLVFMAGYRSYRFPEKDEEVEEEGVLTILYNTLKAGSVTWQGKIAIVGWGLLPIFVVVSGVNAFMDHKTEPGKTVQAVANIVSLLTIVSLVIAHIGNSWIREAKVAAAMDVIPMLLVGNVAFGILMSAVGSFFQSEACQMDVRRDRTDFSGEAFQNTGDFFRLANPIGVIIGAPLIDRVIYPAVATLTGREISVSCKVVAGFCVAIAAQLIAAVLEIHRRDAPVLDLVSKCAPEGVKMSDFNSMWMFIPYGLVGIGEIMVNPTLQYVAYEGAPVEMKPMVQAFNLFSTGALGNGIASVISSQFTGWVPNDLNEGKLESCYYVNTAIGIIGIVGFLLIYRAAPDRIRELGMHDDDGDEQEESCSE